MPLPMPRMPQALAGRLFSFAATGDKNQVGILALSSEICV